MKNTPSSLNAIKSPLAEAPEAETTITQAPEAKPTEINATEAQATQPKINAVRNQRIVYFYSLFVSLFFLAAAPIAVLYTKEWDFFENLWRILTSPSKLVTDYFALGGLGSTLFNAAVCGLIVNLVIIICRVRMNATKLAGYMLVVAHCFYGLNFINMWPPFIGVLLYCIVMKKKVSDNIHIAFFATALAPFVSEMLFRYSVANFDPANMHVNWVGIILAVVCGIGVGFIVLPLLPGTTAMHRGYNLYKAGLAIGMLGIFIYAFMYNTLGITPPSSLQIDNPEYYAMPYAYRGFMNVFFVILFGSTFIAGYLLNHRKVKGYRSLLKCTGYGTDFIDKFGMPMCLINIAVYGCAIMVYLNLVFLIPKIIPNLPAGVGFTGPTVGVVFAALTFSADGQHPRNVFPIVVGYMLLWVVVVAICLVSGHNIPWTLSTQAYINGLAFATGLCPIAGKYGFRYGVIAGFLSATICTVTASMHGGFVLYNGGFTAGLSALILIPMLDFYKIEPKHDDDV
ncbi:MAG: DUF1576 domain-containing protein [Clostridia bacterium]|nr:DUF1576 domain-containing protein [Clostridia bacterium]